MAAVITELLIHSAPADPRCPTRRTNAVVGRLQRHLTPRAWALRAQRSRGSPPRTPRDFEAEVVGEPPVFGRLLVELLAPSAPALSRQQGSRI